MQKKLEKIHLEQIKANIKFNWKNSDFIDSGFVKTCHELVIDVTSLWPLIITEMVQIFSYLEQELSTDTEEWR